MEPLTHRRDLLKGLAASGIVAPVVFRARQAKAALPTLPNLPSGDALLLTPGDLHFKDYQPAFNARTMVTPQLRALCKTEKAVGVMVDWCRSNDLPFALRSGGHCYEGLSQSSGVVIDTRLMNQVALDAASKTVTVGAGASLGDVYRKAGPLGLALPAGSCPTVGVSGHVLGGGYGYLSRPLGLACDSLLSIDLIDPQGNQVHADAQQNADLFWACRGGGGGSFGVATALRFQLHSVPNVLVFHMKWHLPPARAAAIMKVWQAWAPQAPNNIAALLVASGSKSGGIDLRCSGWSTGSLQQLKNELKPLSAAPLIQSLPLLAAINQAAGVNGWKYASGPMKGKSDYVFSVMSDTGIATLMNELSVKPGIAAICDSYGGAIASMGTDATAFAHRSGALFSIQYVSDWTNPADTPNRLKIMSALYAAMRPYVSGGAYVNYCDFDLPDWANAYWGRNLSRLKQIKAAFDPDNAFKHAQSVPLA